MSSEYSAVEFAHCCDTLILVRAAPDSGDGPVALQATLESVNAGITTAVFLHGPGVDWALPAHAEGWNNPCRRSNLLLQVCQTAWQRRHGDQLPQRFQFSSLVQFWNQALHARELISFG